MAIAGSLTYDTKLDTKGFESGLNKISSAGVAIGNLMSDVIKQVAQTISDVAKMGVEYNAQIETYQTALTTLTGSAEKANKIIEQVKKDAAETPFEVASLVKGNQLLISAGLSAEQARDDILALGNAISATGGGEEELSRMVINLQQIKNVGKASALDIKQFAYAGIDVYGLLADYTGKTREEVSDLEISYEDLTGALKFASQEGGKYFNAMEKQSETFNGQLSNLKDNFMAFLGEATMPLFTFLKDEVLPTINGILDGTLGIDEGINKLTETFLSGVMSMVNSLVENLPTFLQMGINILLSLIQGITQALPDLIPTMVQVIMDIVNILLDNIDEIIECGIQLLVALTEGIMNALPELISRLPEIIIKINSKLIELAPQLWSASLRIMMVLIEGMIKYIPEIISRIPKIIKSMVSAFKQGVSDFKNIGKNLLNGLWEGIKNTKDWLLNKIKGFAKTITNGIKSFFGIHSPSKLFRNEIGKNLILGVGVAFEKDDDLINKQISDFGDDVYKKMQGAVNMETGKMAFSGTTGSISQILSSNATFDGNFVVKAEVQEGTLFEAQQRITKEKRLQTGFGG
ncbi:MAG: tape measure protein [Mollicutes bacterium]|nr:tape measure protein [Mollicutes bacterium]